MFSEVTRLDKGVKVIAGRGEGFCGRKIGITGVRTACSLMFLDNENNDDLEEEFIRRKIILRIGEMQKLNWSLSRCVPCF